MSINTKVYSPTLLALQGGGGCQITRKKHYITLEWPHSKDQKFSNNRWDRLQRDNKECKQIQYCDIKLTWR